MVRSRQTYQLLHLVAIFLLAVFAVAAVADAAVCQKITDQDGNCLLPCICCHIAGVIFTTAIIHTEHATIYVQAPPNTALVVFASTFFHPPRA